MFKKEIINHPKFWRSALSVGAAFVILFLVLKWVLDGFSFEFLQNGNPLRFILITITAGFVYGFLVTYGKFWKKFKENQKKS